LNRYIIFIIAGGEKMGPWMMGYGGIGWFFPVLSIIILGLVIWGVVALVRYTVHTGHKGNDSALEILKNRYARGEINKAEYEEKKKDLA
jgi:putative membrane protein